MKIAMLAPIAWRTPPLHYGPWESVVSLLTEGLVARGIDVTLFATGDSETGGTLRSVCAQGYEEDRNIIPKVWEGLHISEVFEHADEFDLIHNHFDFLPLTYSALVSTPVITTIHGFSSPGILPVYEKYNRRTAYVAISDSDRAAKLDYIATIHHGIDLKHFDFRAQPDDYLLFFGRIHPEKGAKEAIAIARACQKPLILAGIIQDDAYFKQYVESELKEGQVDYVGNVGPVRRNQLLGGASALLHPISFNEPFGLSIIEAMACGTPTIAFNRGSMPELIEHGQNGFLVNTSAEAVECVAQIATIDRTQCRQTVEERFTADRMAEQYIDVYKQILKMEM
ncbi:glycosyltransferase family 4 protein [Pontiella sulfatireligans]|uniref:GDP-mannose:cellobiosyl-diphosphopolyprenol alpha-mannosyltransferase n=1 Tax=Pontiella sulfatireligans TaxID=2750658 RepID=A0A6C2UD70_9BACT|nr:glycosyltransferase family 4 protein [Pontiella sulfatireligans]VGO18138.1 GDP-mannose:cellobiosyl-diphosphopolyprenol alpha-mannosyltransferase [Pontiella sulfatireligans]